MVGPALGQAVAGGPAETQEVIDACGIGFGLGLFLFLFWVFWLLLWFSLSAGVGRQLARFFPGG